MRIELFLVHWFLYYTIIIDYQFLFTQICVYCKNPNSIPFGMEIYVGNTSSVPRIACSFFHCWKRPRLRVSRVKRNIKKVRSYLIIYETPDPELSSFLGAYYCLIRVISNHDYALISLLLFHRDRDYIFLV